ncbi:MAG TPA: CRTAC1 family protein, partial [Planctomycetaceae bacterium]|nr:CRTAC1 family protein [Planctomycetaceae bacterium]
MIRLAADRSRLRLLLAALCTFLVGGLTSPAAAQNGARPARTEPAFVFRDTGSETGLLPLVHGIHGHGAAWGDADGDGWIDLYVGTFHSEGPPNMLLRNTQGRFYLDEQPALRISTRATGVVFADFDNDGGLDLYVASMPGPKGSRLAERSGRPLAGCSLFRNEGGGKFSNVSAGNGACPPAFGGRSAAVLDYDGDGLLDLLVGEDPLPGYNGSTTRSSRLFRNLGDLRFEDVSRQVGLPEGIPGLGVAAADVNNDGWPDFFLASSGGGNRLFLNDGRGMFQEAPGSREVFGWPTANGDDMVCGVAFGDVNRDGLLDLVIGQHYERPWVEPVANRLYLNRGINGGVPTFEDVTEQAGLVPLPMKAPHVEVQDFDNDGWPDIATSLVKFADGRPHPVIFKHLGLRDGVPRFRADALTVNDFPTREDKAIRRSGELFDKILRERKIIYTAPGPAGDYDNDGRLDLFLPSWWTESPSLLLHNETPGGHWLDVRVEGAGKLNHMGIGSRVNVYPAGRLADRSALLGSREISVGYGYASGQPAIAHFGLGDVESVDVEVLLPHDLGVLARKAVRANQRVTITTAQKSDSRPAARKRPAAETEVTFPPTLPGGKRAVTDASEQFLTPPPTLKSDVAIAETPPTVDFLYYPGQAYPGQPWSNWGDGIAVNGKYYSAIGDHLAIG